MIIKCTVISCVLSLVSPLILKPAHHTVRVSVNSRITEIELLAVTVSHENPTHTPRLDQHQTAVNVCVCVCVSGIENHPRVISVKQTPDRNHSDLRKPKSPMKRMSRKLLDPIQNTRLDALIIINYSVYTKAPNAAIRDAM